jgi:hypothetical protein
MSDGRWVESDAQWFELQMRYCESCGQIIPTRSWQVAIAGSTRIFCSPDCESLYRSHVQNRIDPIKETP